MGHLRANPGNQALLLSLLFCSGVATARPSESRPSAVSVDKADILSWSPEITSPRRVRALSEPPWYNPATFVDELASKDHQHGFWLVSTSLEDASYRPVLPDHAMDALLPSDPAFQVSSRKLADGKFALRMLMNKSGKYDIRGNNIESRFLFGAINDSFDLRFQSTDKPRVSDQIMVEFQYRIRQLKLMPTSAVSNPRVRFAVGMGTRHMGQNGNKLTSETNFMEVNLARTEGYDYCISGRQPYFGIRLPVDLPRLNSDPSKIYDLRHCWGLSAFRAGNLAASELTIGGELVYYNARTTAEINITSLPDSWRQVRIPMSALIEDYKWQRPPSKWNDAEVAGVYLGIEAWGRALAEWEVKNLLVYKLPQD